MIKVIMMFQSLARGMLGAGYSCLSALTVVSLTDDVS